MPAEEIPGVTLISGGVRSRVSKLLQGCQGFSLAVGAQAPPPQPRQSTCAPNTNTDGILFKHRQGRRPSQLLKTVSYEQGQNRRRSDTKFEGGPSPSLLLLINSTGCTPARKQLTWGRPEPSRPGSKHDLSPRPARTPRQSSPASGRGQRRLCDRRREDLPGPCSRPRRPLGHRNAGSSLCLATHGLAAGPAGRGLLVSGPWGRGAGWRWLQGFLSPEGRRPRPRELCGPSPQSPGLQGSFREHREENIRAIL